MLRSGREATLVVVARAGEADALAAARALARNAEAAAKKKSEGVGGSESKASKAAAAPGSRQAKAEASKAAVEAALPSSVRGAIVAEARLPLTSEAGRVKGLGALALQFGSAFVGAAALPLAGTSEGGESHLVDLARRAGGFRGPSILLVLAGATTDAETVLEDSNVPGAAAAGAVAALVQCGAWPLFAWDPRREEQDGPGALEVHSSHVNPQLRAFAEQETVLSLLTRRSGTDVGGAEGSADGADGAARGAAALGKESLLRSFGRMASRLGAGTGGGGAGSGADADDALVVLYGSDGGNASAIAKRIAGEAKKRGLRTECKAADEFDARKLTATPRIAVVVSTAGQGDVPANCREFWKTLASTDMPQLDPSTRFAVFGMGDSHYWPREDQKHFYNKASKDVHQRLEQLGAEPLVPLGLGDDQDDDGYEEGYRAWVPSLWESLGVSKPSDRAADGEGKEEAAPAHRPDDDIKEDSNHLRGTLVQTL